MRQKTRFKFNAYLTRLAELNGVDTGDMDKKFSVEPAVSQNLMTRVQESSDFLTRINITPVVDMKGEKIGIGVSGSIASTTDTTGGDERETADFSELTSDGYECTQTNYDFHIRYALQHGLVPTDTYKRNSTAYLLAEEVSEAATRAWTAKEQVDIDPLLLTLELTKSEDMPDEVRAKLHKITGYVLRDTGRALDAMEHLKRALQLHQGSGVKKDIERLANELKKQAIASR